MDISTQTLLHSWLISWPQCSGLEVILLSISARCYYADLLVVTMIDNKSGEMITIVSDDDQ